KAAHAVRAATEEALLRMQPEAAAGRADGTGPAGAQAGGNNHAAEGIVVCGCFCDDADVIELGAGLARCVLTVEPEYVSGCRGEEAVGAVDRDGDRERCEPVRAAQDIDLPLLAHSEVHAEDEVAVRFEHGELRAVSDRYHAAATERAAEREVSALRCAHVDAGQSEALQEEAGAQRVLEVEEPGLREVERDGTGLIAVDAGAAFEAGQRTERLGDDVGDAAPHLEAARTSEEVAADPAALG